MPSVEAMQESAHDLELAINALKRLNSDVDTIAGDYRWIKVVISELSCILSGLHEEINEFESDKQKEMR